MIEILTAVGILVALLGAIPPWLTYRNKKRKSNLKDGMAAFWRDIGQLMSRKGDELALAPREIVTMLSGSFSTLDLAKWKEGAPIPGAVLAELLDIYGISASEFRTIAVTHLSANEYSQYIEPVLEGPISSNLSSARLTWWLPFRHATHKIPIIVGPSKSNSQFRVPDASNYTQVDNLGDRDALFEVTRVLSRIYPTCATQPLSCSQSTDVPSVLSSPAILVGGIGYSDGTPNNFVAAKLFAMRKVDIRFSPLGLTFNSTSWTVIRSNSGEVIRDVSVFARLSSPFDAKVKIFSLQGVYTRGVVGSILSFGIGDIALHNHKLVERQVGNRDFIAIFYTDILNGNVFPTRLDESSLYIL